MRWKLHKTNDFWLACSKIVLVVLAISFIGHRLFYNGGEAGKLLASGEIWQGIPLMAWLFLLLFSLGNWFFEIKKWQTLASVLRDTSFSEAANQSLSSHSISIFTPNRIGEYGAKSLFFPKSDWKKVVFLNFLGNMSQLLATVIFGVAGLLFLTSKIDLPFSKEKISIGVLILGLLGFLLLIFKIKKNRFRGIPFYKMKKYVASIASEVKLKLILFSFLKYLLFSHQFYLFLMLFGVEIPYSEAIFAIFSIYLLASVLPSIFVFEAVIKGSIAIWIFSFWKIDEAAILTTAAFMWIFNFALPALFGCYFVLKFKPAKLQSL